MANQIDGGHQARGAVGGIDQEQQTLKGDHDKLRRQSKRSGLDDTLDEELEAERLEPGLRTGGEGETGTNKKHPQDHDNSNT